MREGEREKHDRAGEMSGQDNESYVKQVKRVQGESLIDWEKEIETTKIADVTANLNWVVVERWQRKIEVKWSKVKRKAKIE